MTLLFELREKLKEVYASYSLYIHPILKFVLALAVFINLNILIGFLPFFKNVYVILIMALLCSILPVSAIVIFASIMIVGHCYVCGIEIAVFALVLLLLIVVLFLRFAPKDALALVLTPLAFAWNVPGTIPVALGLLSNAGATVSSMCGVMVYYFLKLIHEKAVILQKGEKAEIVQRIKTMLESFLQNPEMWANIIVFVTIVLVVYCIRKLSVDHAWSIAIVVGVVLRPVLMVAVSFLWDVDSSVILLIISTIGTLILMLILQLFVFSVDYSRSEYVQFEDDDYYYYVKAIPKIKMTNKNRSVKTIQDE